MKAIELTGPSLTSFRATTLPDPEVTPGQVVVRMRAASLNYLDIAVATGSYPGPQFPLIPVADGAGEVVAIGRDVTRVKVGDRVVAHAKPLWVGGAIDPLVADVMRGIGLPGSLAELVVLREDALVKTPAHLDDEAASTLPIAATTAWNGIRLAEIGPGKTALVLGTGGVSIFALQIAKARGGRVIVTSSSDERLARAKTLGADETVNYRTTPDWEKAVLELTGGRGVDLVVETGGAETFGKSLVAAAPGGVVFTIGFLSGADAKANLFPIITKALRVLGNNTGSVADLRDATNAIAAAKIAPVVDRVFALEETPQAYELLAKGGQHFGKIVITHAR